VYDSKKYFEFRHMNDGENRGKKWNDNMLIQ